MVRLMAELCVDGELGRGTIILFRWSLGLILTHTFRGEGLGVRVRALDRRENISKT